MNYHRSITQNTSLKLFEYLTMLIFVSGIQISYSTDFHLKLVPMIIEGVLANLSVKVSAGVNPTKNYQSDR